MHFNLTGNDALIMGILNVTPDSFSDGGRYNSVEAALSHALGMLTDGCDIIDIGAESTRPGHTQISVDEECTRLIPIIRALRKVTDAPLSVDTYRAEVAEEALKNGAHMINDIWGLRYDAQMAEVCARYKVPVCIMHNKDNNDYNDFVSDWLAEIQASVDHALASGIQKENIILDPGIGFAKSFELDTTAMHHLDDLAALGYPVLLGTSRKRMVGNLSGLDVANRDEATAATSVYGYLKGARLFRVHNVKMNRRMLDTIAHLEALKNG